MTCVKVCGLARPDDARTAAEAGADFLGLVFAPSPRQVTPDGVRGWVAELRAAHPSTRWVGVFVDPDSIELEEIRESLALDFVQVHGTLPDPLPPSCIRAVLASELANPRAARARPAPWAWLADTSRHGGSGQTFDWSELPSGPRSYRLFLAGGLDPQNVSEAIRTVRPFAVDASSRLEQAPGQKDPARVRAFIEAVRRADALVPPSEGDLA